VNRPVRTRMPGGVGGGAGNDPAYPIRMPGMLMISGVQVPYGIGDHNR